MAGGVESKSGAPFVIAKAETAFSRAADIFDTTIGWRFGNPLMKVRCRVDSMSETAENVARLSTGREDQDLFSLRTQQRWAKTNASGFLLGEIVPVAVPGKKGESKVFET